MTNEIMQKAVSGLRYIIDGEEFEGKKEIMTIVLMCIEGHICPEENVQGFFEKPIAERKPFSPSAQLYTAFLAELPFGIVVTIEPEAFV